MKSLKSSSWFYKVEFNPKSIHGAYNSPEYLSAGLLDKGAEQSILLQSEIRNRQSSPK
jgi:hypothetical protein